MILLRNLILFLLLAGILAIILRTLASDESTDEASLFLRKLKEGDVTTLVPQFGENACHCQPRGGYLAYLKYESGEQDNLAFLLGRQFEHGEFSVKPVPTILKSKTSSEVPWEKPESVEIDVPIAFSKDSYSPYFLPMDMAYGHPLKKSELDAFCKDPSVDFARNMAVRLRPSLEPGLVAKAAPPDPNRKPEFSADQYMELLPADQTKYVKPTDAGSVLMPDGKTLPASTFAEQLPRLKKATMRLYIGRRGDFKRWAVKKARIKDPLFEVRDEQSKEGFREVQLSTPPEALVDPPKPFSQGQEEGEETSSEQ